MVNVEPVLYLCAKFYNFPAGGAMGCHRHRQGRRAMDTIGAYAPLVLGP